ncbi:4-hydroxy-tetrahydrodipicolinate synthase [Pricia antarctica]|uniref:4-hydroxy-tetrahydrodipicolinate synthase n=1 Tax=Pricia antarctica TaxID=641691 RepID=A0A1G7HF19_9FLAO|nr:dihydrodipicolinate synthase family protein [Pricia antarctica]SDE98961.1 4-hydroxy-tetrahydrodipicolinate synthase [Pricia antarctica]
MKLPLKGIIPPMITPLLENKELDSAGLKNLIEHLLDGGVHGIFLLGTNGEGPSLGYELRKQLITEACEIIEHRVPVLVGITDTSLEASLDIAHHAQTAGADALVVAPPFYFPLAEEEINDYFRVLAPLLPLPFLVYNIPSCTKLSLSPATVKIGKELGAIGVKDSSGDLEVLYAFIEAFKDTPDFSVIVGDELFLSDAILKGGHGSVAGGANVFPKLFVDLYEASLSNDLPGIAKIRKKILHIHDTIYSVENSPTRSIKAIKCALSILGICEDYMASPLKRLSTDKRNEIKHHLDLFEYGKSTRSII